MSKQITQEEYIKKIYDRTGFNIELKSEYIGSGKRIRFVCPYCGNEHESFAHSLTQGYFCRHNIGKNNPSAKSIDSFKKEISDVDSGIEIVGKYVNCNVPIEFICSCGNHAFKEPAQMLLGYTKCPQCAQNRMTLQEYLYKLQNIRPNIRILTHIKEEAFIRKRGKIQYVCECGNIDTKPMESLLNGVSCPRCTNKDSGKKHRKTMKQYLSEVKKINPDVEILSDYVGNENDITFKCSCGNIDKKKARLLIRNKCCCSNCSKSKKKTTQQFKEEMLNVNPNIQILGEYVNAETPIEYICECGKRHSSAPSLLLVGHRCGECNMSKSEYITDHFLNEQNIEHYYDYKFDDCKNKKNLKFDFFLPEYNTCLELDGEHHYMPVNFKGIDDARAKERHEYTKELDKIKDDYCKVKNITLIRIPYWDFDNITKILSESLISLKKVS